MNERRRTHPRLHAGNLVFLVTSLMLLCGPVRAETIEIKLGTVAPAGSTWHQYLQELDAAWNRASDGRVRLKIYAGTLGDEDDIVRRMRIGQIDAATVSTAGLSTVDKAGQALAIPLALKSYEELDYVLERMAPSMEAVLREKGIVVLNWGEAGWVHFFTGAPVAHPDDLRGEKLFVWDTGGASPLERLWKETGFNPVPLSTVDIIPGLQTGMITAFQAPPVAALASQWFPFTDWMTELRWLPLLGATVMTTRAWSRIPADLRPELRRLAEEAGARLRMEVRRLEQDAIEAMKKRGLQIVEVPPAVRREWVAEVEPMYPSIRGELIPAGFFDEVLRLRDEYRARQAQATGASG